MTAAGAAAGGAAAAAAAVAQAIKASGTLVRLEADEMRKLLARLEAPLVVVTAHEGMFGDRHEVLVPHRGLAFYARDKRPFELPGDAEVIASRKIWIPS
jgi:hypothetical protein